MTIDNPRLPLTQNTPMKPRPASPSGRLTMLLWLFPLLLTAMLASYFAYQYRYDEQFRYYPYAWHGRWITTSDPNARTGFFRRTIDITGPIQSAYMEVTAKNAFGVRVNGQRALLFYVYPEDAKDLPGELSQFSHEGIEPTNYAAFGNMRRHKLGHLYSIAPFLHPGKNVIAISTVSDDGPPCLAAQIVVRAGYRHEIVSDAGWKVSTTGPNRRDVSWFSPNYFDGDWRNAIDTGQPIRIPVDGDAMVIDEPLRGCFIGGPLTSAAVPMTFERQVLCPATAQAAWMRLSSTVDYDILLNGRTISSASTLDHYRHDFAQRQRDDYESFGRIRTEGFEDNTPPPRTARQIDVFLLKNMFHRGRNTLQVVLHPAITLDTAPIPMFQLDAGLTFPGRVSQSLATDGCWRVTTSSFAQPARVASFPDHTFEGFDNILMADQVDAGMGSDARILRNSVILTALLLILTLAPALWLARTCTDRCRAGTAAQGQARETLRCLGTLFLAPAIVLLGAAVMQSVFIYSPQDQYLNTPYFAGAALLTALIAGLMTLGATLVRRGGQSADSATARRGHGEEPPTATRSAGKSYAAAATVCGITLVALLFCTHELTRNSLIPDEYVSLLAARGILHRGIPVFENTHIIYTRSALFHYLLALVMAASERAGNLAYTRLLGIVWQIALIPLVYIFGRTLRGRVTGLVACVLVAFSPYEIFLAREARFYTEFAFFATLTCYFLYQSLNNPDDDRYRCRLMMAYCAAYMSQELAISLVPAIVVSVALSGQARLWLSRRNLAWIAVALAITLADFYVYSHYCVTPLPFIDRDSSPLMAIHTDSLELMASMLFINIERTQLVVGFLYFAGMAYALTRLLRAPEAGTAPGTPITWPWWSFLYLVTGLTIAITTLIAAHAAGRYTVHMAPLVALAAACVLVDAARWLHRTACRDLGSPLAARLMVVVYVLTTATVCAAAYRPVRTWDAMSRTENRDDTEAARYVASRLQPGDKIVAFNPEICMVEIGRCDYHWRPLKESRDKYFSRDGTLRERDSGAVEIDNADKIRRLISQNARVWLIVPPRVLRVPDADNPTAMEAFLQQNLQVAYSRENVEVFLWDRRRNHFRNAVRNDGFDQFNNSL